jgi:hypothetical protein
MKPIYRDIQGLWLALAALCLAGFPACDDGSGPATSSELQPDPAGASAASSEPNFSFARELGLAPGQVTAQDARAIAELATGGTALSIEQEDEDAWATFDVTVHVGKTVKEVEVRISDGAVLEIEDESEDADDSGDDGDEEHEEGSSEKG